MPRTVVTILTLSLTLALSACGSSSTSSTSSTTQPTTQSTTRIVLSQGNWQAAAAPAGTRDLTGTNVVLLPVTLTSAATLDVTATWASQSNDVEFAIHQGTCSFSNLGTSGCVALLESGKPTTRGVTLSKAVAAGNYTMMIVNFGPGAESGTYQVGATP